jgi:hypothetical protein
MRPALIKPWIRWREIPSSLAASVTLRSDCLFGAIGCRMSSFSSMTQLEKTKSRRSFFGLALAFTSILTALWYNGADGLATAFK